MKIRTIAHKRLVVGEKKQRFGFRKTILGLCGAILGSTLLMAEAANNTHTVHAAESNPDQAKSVQIDDSAAKEVAQTKADVSKNNDASTDASKASAKTPVAAKDNEGTKTTNGLNSKADQPLAKKEVPQFNSSLKQVEKAGTDKSGRQLGSQTGTQGTGTGANKGAQGDKSADVAGKYIPNQNQVTTHSTDTHSEVTGKTASTSPSSSSAVNTETTSASKALLTDKEALTHVAKNNFLDYFSLNGSATYDKTTGIVTITPDDFNKIGNFSLKSKIDMNTSFTLTGKVNLGSHSPYGADGISFAFHNGNTTDIGNAGGNLGIGGLQNALGFKLDTWTNVYQAPLSDKDGSQIDPTDSNDFGWNGDSMNAPYGTFVDTENDEVATKDGIKVQRWWAKDVDGTSQALSKDDVNGQFHDFTVDYDGDKRTLTIKYTQTSGKILTWTSPKPVSKSNQAMAMIVSASTGGAKNLQQFEIMNFDFKPAATVNVKYVDTKGNQITKGKVTYPSGTYVKGTYDATLLNIPNYTFIKMSDSDITGGTSLPASGTLKNPGDNGTVIYVYAPAYSTTMKTVNETINYIDQSGNSLPNIDSHQATPITFVTVTNPVTKETTTYYKNGTQKQPPLDVDGQPGSTWTKSNEANFQAVTNPPVPGYHVIKTTDPTNDLTQTTSKTVYITNNGDSKDLEFTVTYTKNAPT
ncbi:lectin-like domain-containing protein, partial [Lactobacillus helveticus]|uniref:lectin-like domain-containing protein n=1 Tax=Lactobacillus helveticus TaxID=1587 RepID=UPI0015671EC1